jgi:hypothetical protein
MKVGGQRIRDHLRLLTPLLLFVIAVWLIRILLGAAGAPLWLSRLFSVIGAAAVSIFLAVLMIHFRRFGSYANVVAACLILNFWAQALIIAAIIFSVLTNTTNIYTFPEFSMPGDDPLHLRHIYGHFTFGIGLGTLFGAAMGCLMLWLLRAVVPAGGAVEGSSKQATR